MFDLSAIQSAIREFGFDGWLLYDFRGSNILARRILQIPDSVHSSRRFLYWIPASGEPHRIVHRIEDSSLDHLPGGKTVYLRWQELRGSIEKAVQGTKRIAMEYSPLGNNPAVSRVDAGTYELVRSFGPEVGSSGDLVQLFEAAWDDEQERMHFDAAEITNAAYGVAWRLIADRLRSGGARKGGPAGDYGPFSRQWSDDVLASHRCAKRPCRDAALRNGLGPRHDHP